MEPPAPGEQNSRVADGGFRTLAVTLAMSRVFHLRYPALGIKVRPVAAQKEFPWDGSGLVRGIAAEFLGDAEKLGRGSATRLSFPLSTAIRIARLESRQCVD